MIAPGDAVAIARLEKIRLSLPSLDTDEQRTFADEIMFEKFGAEKARGIKELLESANIKLSELDALGEAAQEDLVRAFTHLEAGELAEAERLFARLDDLAPKSRLLLREVARGRAAVAMAHDLVGEDLKGVAIRIREVDDHLLPKLPNGQRKAARFAIVDGQPVIFMRKGGSLDAVREELTHHLQWLRDPVMRARMENVSEEALANYQTFDLATKRARHLDALEIEADVQRRLIHQLEESAEEYDDALLRLTDADETLALIEEKIAKLEAAKVPEDLHGLVDEVPQLFSSTVHTPAKVTGWHASRVRGLLAKQPSLTDPAVRKRLRAFGYRVSEGDDPTKMVRIVRDQKYAHRLPHLRIKPDLTIEEITSSARPSFAQRAAAAPKEWQELQESMALMQLKLDLGKVKAADVALYTEAIRRSGPQFRAALANRVQHGVLDKAGAGLLSKWGEVVDKLADDFKIKIDDLLADLPKTLTEAEIKKFRRNLRDRIAKALMTLPDKKRVGALYEMLEALPESASLGHGFGSFRLEFLNTSKQTKGIFKAAGVKPPPFKGADLRRARQADDVIEVLKPSMKIPPGRYLGEDKAGADAFDIEQTADIFKRWDKKLGGIVQNVGDTTKAYDGQIFFFARESEAKAAYKAMRGHQR